jgi:hypothetical protein
MMKGRCEGGERRRIMNRGTEGWMGLLDADET